MFENNLLCNYVVKNHTQSPCRMKNCKEFMIYIAFAMGYYTISTVTSKIHHSSQFYFYINRKWAILHSLFAKKWLLSYSPKETITY